MDSTEENRNENSDDSGIGIGNVGKFCAGRVQARTDEHLWHGLSSLRPRRERGTQERKRGRFRGREPQQRIG